MDRCLDEKVVDVYPVEFPLIHVESIDLGYQLTCLGNYSKLISFFQNHLEHNFYVSEKDLSTNEFQFMLSVIKEKSDLFGKLGYEVSSSNGFYKDDRGNITLLYDLTDEENLYVGNGFVDSFCELLEECRADFLKRNVKQTLTQLMAISWFDLKFSYAGEYIKELNTKETWKYPIPYNTASILQGLVDWEFVASQLVGKNKQFKLEVLSAFDMVYALILDEKGKG